jgi:hypothetical protein
MPEPEFATSASHRWTSWQRCTRYRFARRTVLEDGMPPGRWRGEREQRGAGRGRNSPDAPPSGARRWSFPQQRRGAAALVAALPTPFAPGRRRRAWRGGPTAPLVSALCPTVHGCGASPAGRDPCRRSWIFRNGRESTTGRSRRRPGAGNSSPISRPPRSRRLAPRCAGRGRLRRRSCRPLVCGR